MPHEHTTSPIDSAIERFQHDDFDQCQKICESILQESPNNPDILHLLGCTKYSQKKYNEALDNFNQAIEADNSNALFYLNAAKTLLELKNDENAEVFLRKALDLNPRLIDVHFYLAKIFYTQKKFSNTQKAIENTLALDPNHADAQHYRGIILMEFGKLKDAIGQTEQLLSEHPDHLGGHELLIILYERINDLDAVKRILANAEKKWPDHPAFILGHAKYLKRQKQFQEAEEYIKEKIALVADDPKTKADVTHELALILDKQGKNTEAYDTFVDAHTQFKEFFEHDIQISNYFGKKLENSLVYFSKDIVSSWPQAPSNETAHFLVGFPRSGTTLAEHILAAHPHILCTQEPSFLDIIIQEMTTNYPYALDTLSEEEHTRLVQSYKTRCNEWFSGDITDKLIVDKNPLDITNLGFIYRLLPNSKIIVMIRDPRDTCLSCFIQAFRYNSATSHFFALESTIKTYAKVMELYARFKEILPLNILEIRYEDLVTDIEPHARNMISFLEQPWDNEVLDYYTKSEDRYAHTPSYEGVVKPVYTSSIGRWKTYEKYFEPYTDILSPYLTKYGYLESTI